MANKCIIAQVLVVWTKYSFFEKTPLSMVELVRSIWYFTGIDELRPRVVGWTCKSQVADVNLGKIETLLGRCGNGDEIQRL